MITLLTCLALAQWSVSLSKVSDFLTQVAFAVRADLMKPCSPRFEAFLLPVLTAWFCVSISGIEKSVIKILFFPL